MSIGSEGVRGWDVGPVLDVFCAIHDCALGTSPALTSYSGVEGPVQCLQQYNTWHCHTTKVLVPTCSTSNTHSTEPLHGAGTKRVDDGRPFDLTLISAWCFSTPTSVGADVSARYVFWKHACCSSAELLSRMSFPNVLANWACFPSTTMPSVPQSSLCSGSRSCDIPSTCRRLLRVHLREKMSVSRFLHY